MSRTGDRTESKNGGLGPTGSPKAMLSTGSVQLMRAPQGRTFHATINRKDNKLYN
jgi:hypothetical protein